MKAFAAVCAYLMLIGQSLAGSEFNREVLATLEYGVGPGQALVVQERGGPGSPEGITDFWVSDGLCVWIAEGVLGRIQKFDSNGELDWVANNIDCINGIAVDEKGWVFTRGGSGRGDVTIVHQNGTKVWETLGMYPGGPEERARIDAVIQNVEGRFSHRERRLRGLRVEEGKTIRDKHGGEYSIRRAQGEKDQERVSIEVLDSASGESREVRVPAGFYVSVDEEGRIWVTEVVDRPETKLIMDRVGENPVVWASSSELRIAAYDHEGRELARLTVDRPPHIIGSANVEVKRDGSVVLLEYQSDHVEVVRYVLEDDQADGEAEPEGEDAAELVGFKLRSTDPMVRQIGVELLVSKGQKGLDEVIEMLDSPDANVRGGAAEALGRIGDKKAVGPLLRLVQDEDRYVRRRAVQALGELRAERAVRPLVGRLSDNDWFVRWKVAEALGKIGGSGAIEALLIALEDENRYVRDEATAVLQRMKDPTALEMIAMRLGHEDDLVRIAAARVLESIVEDTGDTRALQPLLKALDNRCVNVQEIAARALGHIGEPAVEPLLRLLNHELDYVVRGAAKALGEIGDHRAVDPLLALLPRWEYHGGTRYTRDPFVRKISVRALGKIGDAAAIDSLVKIVESSTEDSGIRSDAAKALGAIGEPALSDLLRLVKSADFHTRGIAVTGLMEIDDEQASKAVKDAQNDPHGFVRTVARQGSDYRVNP